MTTRRFLLLVFLTACRTDYDAPHEEENENTNSTTTNDDGSDSSTGDDMDDDGTTGSDGDSAGAGGDSSDSAGDCMPDLGMAGPYCGDGVIDDGEVCDGDSIDCDGYIGKSLPTQGELDCNEDCTEYETYNCCFIDRCSLNSLECCSGECVLVDTPEGSHTECQ